MMQWMSGTFQIGVMLLAFFALAQWPALADAGPSAQPAAVGAEPAHLGWMLEQHWRVVDGR